MKIKHWQGYGTVSATRIKDKSCTLHVLVTGNHEWGLRRDDLYDLYFGSRYQDPDLSNVKAKYLDVNGSPAILMVSDFKADGKTLYEYFIEPIGTESGGVCCYVYFECPTEDAATITSYINSFKVS